MGLKLSRVIPLLTFSLTISVCPAPASDLVQVSSYHGGEVKAKSGLVWLGLFPTKTKSETKTEKNAQYKLRKTRVKITIVYDGINDEPGQKTGKKITIPDNEEPVFLVRGVDSLKPGPVETCHYKLPPSTAEQLPCGTKLPLKLKNSKTYLHVKGSKKGDTISNCTLTLESNGRKQVIYNEKEVGDSGTPKLLWAGDLDGDGKLDLFMDTTNHYNISRPTLFLSGKAKRGKLVQEVAFIDCTGC